MKMLTITISEDLASQICTALEMDKDKAGKRLSSPKADKYDRRDYKLLSNRLAQYAEAYRIAREVATAEAIKADPLPDPDGAAVGIAEAA